MNILSRFIRRLKFRASITSDESNNVVDGIVKAQQLYKELSLKVHPDLNPDKIDIAEELMKRVVENRFNYAALLSLKQEIAEKLQ